MEKVIWDKKRIENLIHSFGVTLEEPMDVEAIEMDNLYYNEIDPHKDLFSWESVSSKHLFFSSNIFNHKDMPDDVITSALAYSYCVKVVHNRVLSERTPFSDLKNMDDLVKNMLVQLGVDYCDKFAVEEYVRPIRRQLFKESEFGGCYYLIGDRVRPEPAVPGWKQYEITNIHVGDKEIIVTCHSDDGEEISMEEAAFFKSFFLFS